jgi:uncharacterized membrane protein
VWVLLPVYGIYRALTDGVGHAWISRLLPEETMGTGLGTYQAITGICVLLAGIWAGQAWNGTGRIPLLVSGALSAVLAVVMLVIGWRAGAATTPSGTAPGRSAQ